MVRLYRATRTRTDPATGKKSKVHSKRWKADYFENGKRRRHTLGTPFKADAELARARIIERLRQEQVGVTDPFAAPRAVPIARHLRKFLVGVRANDRSPVHLWRLRRCLVETLRAIGAKRVADLDADEVLAHLDALRRSGKGARTVNHRIAAIKQFSRWMVMSRKLPFDPFASIKRLRVDGDRRRRRRALTNDERAALVEAARHRPLREAESRAAREAAYRRENGGAASSRGRGVRLTAEGLARLRALGDARGMVYSVLGGTGLRPGEASRLRWCDLNFDLPMLTVPAASAKARVEQKIGLALTVRDALRRWRSTRKAEPDSALVFPRGTIPTPRTFAKDLAAASIPARAADGTVVDLYALRMTFITSLPATGAHPRVAQALARHSSVEITMKHYTDLQLLGLQGVLDRAVPPIPADLCVTESCHETVPEGQNLASPVPTGASDEAMGDPLGYVENEALRLYGEQIELVGAVGLEPTTTGLKGPCSTG
jgi:integrase